MTSNMTRENDTSPHTLRISDKRLASLIADADKMLERHNPVIKKEWWQDFRSAMLELQELRQCTAK